MTARPHRVYDPLKRLIDAVLGTVALILSSPVQAVVAVLVAVKLGRPVIFRQTRPGRGGRPFTMYKFRSMRPAAPGETIAADADRLTPFGRVLRSTSLDELPSILNIVKGDMSIVGPRPLLMQYLSRYTPDQARRHEVRPGLTGLAQVSGRNAVGWEERFALDVEYVDRRSFRLDARIIAKTVMSVVRRDGISSEDSATMTEFQGSDGAAA